MSGTRAGGLKAEKTMKKYVVQLETSMDIIELNNILDYYYKLGMIKSLSILKI